MTPTEFDFTITIPADKRLVAAIRHLTTHAAGYAQLDAQAGERLAGHVERATASAIAASPAPAPNIEYRFTADPEALVVMFACEAGPAAAAPGPSRNGAISVEWTSEGSRQVCRIRQPLAS